MEKIKEYKWVWISVLVLFVGSFYWTQIRPVQIKKDCAWFTQTIPADRGLTKAEADIMNEEGAKQCDSLNKQRTTISCILDDHKERLPQPEKQIVREATKSEFDSCLRRNGL